MILDNYKKLCQVSYGGDGAQNTPLKNIIDGSNVAVTEMNDQRRVMALLGYWNFPQTISSNYGAFDVGFDDTPESTSDYIFHGNFYKRNIASPSEPALTPISYSAPTKAIGEIINHIVTYRNETGSNITVREIAVLSNPTQVSNGNKYVMLIRKVLDTPITIAPGESYTFQYILRFKNA